MTNITGHSIRLEATPSSSLFDDDLHVSLSGLSPCQKVTLVAVIAENGEIVVSHGHYVTDDKGVVDVRRSSSHGGSYTGVEPVGLLWSMKPATGQEPGLLFRPTWDKPVQVRIYVILGFREVKSADEVMSLDDVSIASADVTRYIKAPDVQEFKVHTGYVRGLFYLPPGEGPFPGVLLLPGVFPSYFRCLASPLASRGFAVLTIAYYGCEDLPKDEIVFHLECLQESIDWLLSHPSVVQSGVGVVGYCKGGSLAVHVANLSDRVKAVIAICSRCYDSIGTHFWREVEQPVYNAGDGRLLQLEEGVLVRCDRDYDPTDPEQRAALIPVEKCANVPMLFIVGEDDIRVSSSHITTMVERLEADGCTNYRVLSYPGMGHIFKPPYNPHFRAGAHAMFGANILYGGETRAHAKAQEDAWKQIQSFLRQRLDPANPQ